MKTFLSISFLGHFVKIQISMFMIFVVMMSMVNWQIIIGIAKGANSQYEKDWECQLRHFGLNYLI